MQAPARDRRRRGARLGLWAALAAALTAVVALPAQGAERLAWITPGRARAIPWGDAAPSAGREVDPRAPVALGAEELLVLPADPGDRFEIWGEISGVGVGTGVGDAPDGITWVPLPKLAGGRREVGIPPWTSARFLVLRPAVPGSAGTTATGARNPTSPATAPITVHVAARESAALAWYRLDEDVADWLLRGGEAPRALTVPLDELGTALAAARPLLRWVEAARDALAPAPGEPVSGAAASWLVARYLEESLRVRPLTEPYFLRRGVDVEGGAGEAPLDAADHATSWQLGVARAGEGAGKGGDAGGAAAAARVTLTTPADVLRLGFRARASGPARAIVRAGGAVVRELVWRTSPRLMDRARWSEARWIRAVLPVGAREVTVEVVQGEVAVAAIGHRQRVGVADFFEVRRDRDEAFADAAGGASLAALLARADQAPVLASASAARAALAAATKRPPLLQTLIHAEASRWAASPAEARMRVSAAFEAARRAPDALVAPLLRVALERLSAAHADPLVTLGTVPGQGRAGPLPWAGWGATLALRPGVDADDAATIRALGDALSASADGRRPLAGAEADRFAAAHGDIPGAASRAREAWTREGGWGALDAAPGVTIWSALEEPRDQIPEGPAPTCAVVGPQGLRWTLLDAPRTVIPVDAPPGTHARVLLRGASAGPEPESLVRIDEASVAVHAGAGVASVVAVSPGARTFSRAPGAPPVLARIPRVGEAPCATLRDVLQWAWVEGDATFLVPDRDRATVARVVIAPSPVLAAAQPGAPPRQGSRRLTVSAGGITYEGWIRADATGAIEVPVPAGAGELRVHASEGVLLRASARLHPALPSPERIVAPRGGGPLADVDDLLGTVRASTRALRRASDAERPVLKERRAVALDMLGFPALAALDRAPPIEVADLSLEAGATLAFTLPPGSPPVVPIGLLGRLAPLALPPDLAPLGEARSARRAGDVRRGIEILTPTAARSTAADALLLGLLAEREGDVLLGSETFLRLGLAHRDGRVIARAATLATDLAAVKGDRLLALRAFAIAELAAQTSAARAAAGDTWPDPSPAALARLAPVISWKAPPRVDHTAGSASLDVRAGPEPEQPLPARVRRALVDAPEGALLMTEGAFAQLHFDRPAPFALALEGACRHLDGPETPCQLDVRLDGEAVTCASGAGTSAAGGGATPAGAPTGAPTPVDPVLGPGALRCSVAVPRGRHRVEIRPPPEVPVVAWVRGLDAGQPYPGRVMSTWSDIDPARPLELVFAGPTVVRLRARPAYECATSKAGAAGGAGDDPTCHPDVTTTAAEGALHFTVTSPSSDDARGSVPPAPLAPPTQPGEAMAPTSSGSAAPAPEGDTIVEQGDLVLDPTEDPWARRSGVRRAPFFWLGHEVERRIAILGDGPHVLRVSSPAGRALVRVEIAVAHRPPRPRDPPPPPAGLTPEPGTGSRLRWAPPVGRDPVEGALLLAGYIRTTDGNMSDEDLRAGIRFYEIGVDASREVLPGALWAGATAFTRLRTGTTSLGAELRLDSAGGGFVPSLSAQARMVAQPPALGGRVGLSAAWGIPLGEVTLIPWASAALLAVDDSLAGRADADRDVYTVYSSERRTLASLGARFRFRPAVDAIASIGPSVRVSPLFSAVDRIDLRADLDVLHGRGLWPWVQLGWVGSYRPTNEAREEAFLRNTFSFGLMFWSWFSRGHRISLASETALLVDTPASIIDSPRFGLALLLRYDWTGSRGLRDLPPRLTPFRDRLEEGSGVVAREPPATEPRWDDDDDDGG
ncbi:hypothetical protein [Chondromyces apiculatus]|uniref:Uncharacterized protein n=1 Tax=Chondromyces apiculatus DSM 436 TaxID=1192034 RepID=A0A017TCY5_9BACT|nr:hypothetical protein [Chondromyces apiculatus]EYF06792.1 Hypothetical protein CAP_1489 [Chondromyces apiculatus DSM 436]